MRHISASNFNVLVVDYQGQELPYPVSQYMASIKSQNPSVKIFGYKNLPGMIPSYEDWAEVNNHEDWFVHDAYGNRVKDTRWGFYLMDVGNYGWRQHFVSYINNKMATYGAYDGVYADTVWDTLMTTELDRAVPASVLNNWHANTLGMLQYIKANLWNGKLLIVNTEAGWAWGHTNYDYLNAADGMEIEGYFHAPWEDSWSYTKIADSLINCLAYGVS